MKFVSQPSLKLSERAKIISYKQSLNFYLIEIEKLNEIPFEEIGADNGRWFLGV